MIYKASTKDWESIRTPFCSLNTHHDSQFAISLGERGIPRGSSPHIPLITRNMVPFHCTPFPYNPLNPILTHLPHSQVAVITPLSV